MDKRLAQHIALTAAVAAALMVTAFLLGLKLTAPAPLPSVDESPGAASLPATDGAQNPPAADAVDDMMSHLHASAAALQQCVSAMKNATVANKGGYVEKSRTDLAQAQADMAAAIDYMTAHPTPANQRAPATLPDFPAEPAAGGGVPNLRKGLAALATASTELSQTRGGDLGGFRAKLNADFKRAADDIVAGINFNRGVPVQPAGG